MEQRHYNTAGRTLLVEYLARHAALCPQSAAEIYAGLCQESAHAPGHSSVYRLIGRLCEEGTLRRTRAAGKKEFCYQYVGTAHTCHSHFHLQCLRCGQVEHLECDCGGEIAAHLMGKHGFAVDAGKSVLYGICAGCRGEGQA